MKKYILTFCILVAGLLNVKGQADNVFTTVPVTNGKVIFQEFIHTDQSLTPDQKYAILYKWGKDNYAGNPLLSGIRFDDKARTITVSSKANLGSGNEKIVMNYRFDASVTNAGCMLTIRDITYNSEKGKGNSIFPTAYTAEQMITDQTVNSGDDKELRNSTRKATLSYFNGLHGQIKGLFQTKK